jgi:ribose 5-phosphate isomerase B
MIYLAGDHAGFELKEKIKIWLKEWSHEFVDCGAFSLDLDDDYPDFVSKAILKIKDDDKGIILGGSGQGEAIVANRVSGIRAAVYYGGDLEVVKLSREHNNANVLSLGARFLEEEEAKKAVKLWLETEFSGEERHKRRLNKIR